MNSKPSKSARKREYLALQTLGERLIALAPEQLANIGLDEVLHDAIVAAKSIRSNGALRRQKQLIGKLMRTVDPAPIAAALDAYGRDARLEKDIFRRAEKWRERLTSGGKAALDEFNHVAGYRNPLLADALSDWSAAANDTARRVALRRAFREIHKDLRSTQQKGKAE
ncbi:MAG: ribosome biogenesis factor YjgA [Woeseiaceae bacterium]